MDHTALAAKLFMDMVDLDPSRKRTNHLLKVTGYALALGVAEGLDGGEMEALRIAAVLHDIGIRISIEKHGSGAGEFQQVEGPPLARKMLEPYGVGPAVVDRVCHLIAHHHDYANIDGRDCQILVEADFLVNCDEKGMEKEQIRAIRGNVFKTAAGTDLLNRLFEL